MRTDDNETKTGGRGLCRLVALSPRGDVMINQRETPLLWSEVGGGQGLRFVRERLERTLRLLFGPRPLAGPLVRDPLTSSQKQPRSAPQWWKMTALRSQRRRTLGASQRAVLTQGCRLETAGDMALRGLPLGRESPYKERMGSLPSALEPGCQGAGGGGPVSWDVTHTPSPPPPIT